MPSKERVGAHPGYRRRQPEITPLYEVIATHLTSFRDHVRDEYYVEEEFDQYLRCGILAHGFLRARCRDCGRASRSSTAAEELVSPSGPAAGESSLPVAAAKSCSTRINWAELLKRIYDADVLACESGGRLRFIALVTEPETARVVLRGYGLPAELPRITSSRPPSLTDFFDVSPADCFDPPSPEYLDAPPPDW